MIRFLLAVLLLQINYASAQTCGTESPYEYPERFTPQQLALHQVMEQGLLDYKLSGSRDARAEIISLPVVVHIVHRGEAVGDGSNLTNAQVQQTITQVNTYLRNMNGFGVDLGVELCLAKTDPDGNETNGIVRVNGSSVTEYANTGITTGTSCLPNNEDQVKALSAWPHTSYLNIWIVHSICSSTGTIAGYANLPWTYDDNLQGMVIRASSFLGIETPVHETGHILGLYHTHEGDGGGNTCPGNGSCGLDGDKCCDTEPMQRYSCTTNDCGIGTDWDDTRFNFMSYCQLRNRFTPDQFERVNYYLTQPVSDLAILAASTKCNTNGPLPAMVYTSHLVDDAELSTGNNNGMAEAGETVDLDITIQNAGPADANHIAAGISTNNPAITILDASANYGDLQSGDNASSSSFKIKIADDAPAQNVLFNMNIISDEGSWQQSFTLQTHQSTGIKSIGEANVSLYPNPNTGYFTLSFPTAVIKDAFRFEIYNAMGQQVQTLQPKTDAKGMQVELVNAVPGVYFIRVLNAARETYMQRFSVVK